MEPGFGPTNGQKNRADLEDVSAAEAIFLWDAHPGHDPREQTMTAQSNRQKDRELMLDELESVSGGGARPSAWPARFSATRSARWSRASPS
jgi:hypothetical protein